MPESFERGALTEAVFYILLSLYTPMHGYAVMQNIEKMSKGRVVLGAGTLYGAINTLMEKGWIASVSNDKDSRKKEHMITDSGKAMMHFEILRLEELLSHGKNIVEG